MAVTADPREDRLLETSGIHLCRPKRPCLAGVQDAVTPHMTQYKWQLRDPGTLHIAHQAASSPQHRC